MLLEPPTVPAAHSSRSLEIAKCSEALNGETHNQVTANSTSSVFPMGGEAAGSIVGGPAKWSERVTALWKNPSARRGFLALFDQAVVSGTNLLASIIVGRTLGAEGLGVYALGVTMVVLWTTVHDSLVTGPYTVLGATHRPRRRTELATSVAGLHFIVCGLVALVFVGAGWFGTAVLNAEVWSSVALALAVVMPAVLFRQLARRFAFAHLRPGLAVAIDVISTAIQIGLLVALAISGLLTPVAALLALAVAGGLTGIAGLSVQRRRFARQHPQWPLLVEPLKLGCWILAARAMGVVHSFGMHWVIAAILGTTATGVFAACVTIAMIANPLILGMGNFLGPQAAMAHAHSGRRGLARVIGISVAVMAITMLAIATGLAVFGEWLLAILFGNSDYSGNGIVIAILALHGVVGAISVCLHHGLITANRGRSEVAANVVSIGVTFVPAVVVVGWLGIAGAALVMCIGNIAGTAIQAVAFCRYVHVPERQPPISTGANSDMTSRDR